MLLVCQSLRLYLWSTQIQTLCFIKGNEGHSECSVLMYSILIGWPWPVCNLGHSVQPYAIACCCKVAKIHSLRWIWPLSSNCCFDECNKIVCQLILAYISSEKYAELMSMLKCTGNLNPKVFFVTLEIWTNSEDKWSIRVINKCNRMHLISSKTALKQWKGKEWKETYHAFLFFSPSFSVL